MAGKRHKRPLTAPDEINAAERRAFVLRLRKRGMSYSNIARATNLAVSDGQVTFDVGKDYDERRAHRDVMAELTRIRIDIAESVDDIRSIELERIDTALASVWGRIERPLPANPNILERAAYENSQDKAISTFLRLAERRAKLLGLDAPTKTALTDGDGKDIAVKLYAQFDPNLWPDGKETTDGGIEPATSTD